MFSNRGLFGGGVAPVTKVEGYDRLYAIGDIHGCHDELKVILDHLENKENLTSNDQVIFIGDYIDRGDDSPGVVSTLISFKKRFPRTEFLRGNHEDMLLSFFGYSKRIPGCMYGADFLRNGGTGTLEQYGKTYDEVVEAYYTRSQSFRWIPRDHRRFFLNCKIIIDTPDAQFVHAGLNTAYGLDEQAIETCVWDREMDWCMVNLNPEKVTVYGHTPRPNLNWHYKQLENGQAANKINIDTGCVYHLSGRCPIGRLTCLNVKDMCAFTVMKGEDRVTNVSRDYLLEEK